VPLIFHFHFSLSFFTVIFQVDFYLSFFSKVSQIVTLIKYMYIALTAACASILKSQLDRHCNDIHVQPIAVAQNLEIISKNIQSCTRRTRILVGFIIYYLVQIVNPMGRILVRWTSFENHLEIQCHPICYRLHLASALCTAARTSVLKSQLHSHFDYIHVHSLVSLHCRTCIHSQKSALGWLRLVGSIEL